jgi:hypothetical protein
MALLGNFIGGALGLRSAAEYATAVESADKLKNLRRRNTLEETERENRNKNIFREDSDAASNFTPDDAFKFDNLDQPGLKNIPKPPPVVTDKKTDQTIDQEGGVAQGQEYINDGSDLTLPDKGPPPFIPDFDSSKTVINPNKNQNVNPNRKSKDQIPRPEFRGPDLSRLFPEGVVQENDVSDEEKADLHVQGMPWRVQSYNLNGEKAYVVLHNGVEYNIKEVGEGSFILVDRNGVVNNVLTEAFTKARIRGITDTELVKRGETDETELAAKTVDNSFVSNALKTIKENKFKSGITESTVNFARLFGINEGEALGLLAVESNFGTVKYNNRSSTRGPLQIQGLAYKDVQTFYKGNNPAGSGLTDVQWSQMVDIAKNLPKNHGNLTNSSDQIAAGLLYYKMIGLKGVAPEFRPAAYYDGYSKYIGIDKLSDVENFSGPNTLRSVEKYNSAVLGMTEYLGKVSEYYYGDGAASETTEVTEEVTEEVTKEIASTDETGGAAASADVTGTNVEVTSSDGTKSPSLANEGVEPEDDTIIKFLQDPPKIGIEIQNILDGRKRVVDTVNERINLINRRVERNNQKARELERLAEIAGIQPGGLARYNQLRAQAEALREENFLLLEGGITADGQEFAGVTGLKRAATEKMAEFDNKLLYVQGAQALQDLSYGSTARAGAVLSAYSGLDIQVVPRSDGRFDVVVQGQTQATYNYNQLVDKLQSTYSAQYRETKATKETYLFEKNVDLEAELTKQRDKLLGDLKLKNLENAGKAYIEELKARKGEFKALGEGYALIYDNGKYFLLEPQAETVTVNGEAVVRPKLTPLSPAQATALNTGSADASATAEAYKSASE